MEQILQAFLNLLRRKDILNWPEETRCHTCAEAKDCPAFDTGVIRPCPYYQRKEA